MGDPEAIPLANPVSEHWNWQGGSASRSPGGDSLPETALHWPKHGFTHVDAPCHIVPNGPTLDDCELRRLCGEAAIVDVSDRVPARPVGRDLLEKRGRHVREGDILILRSGLHERFPNTTPDYWQRSPWLDDDGSRWVVERGCAALAVDFPQDRVARELGTRAVENREFTEHRIVLGAGLMHLEHVVDLHRIRGERTFLIGLPLRLPGADGGPAGPIALTRWPGPKPKISDLTLPLLPGERVQTWLEKSFEKGDPVQETGLRIEGHAGTHVLAPRYLDPDAEGVESFLGTPLAGPADLVDLPPGPDPVGAAALAGARSRRSGARILLLRAPRRSTGGTGESAPALAPDAAEWIVREGYRAVGSDFEPDAGRRRIRGSPRRSDLESEAVLLENGLALIRNLQGLGALEGKRLWAVALPLRLPGAESAPARVVALEWRDGNGTPGGISA